MAHTFTPGFQMSQSDNTTTFILELTFGWHQMRDTLSNKAIWESFYKDNTWRVDPILPPAEMLMSQSCGIKLQTPDAF